MIWCLLIFLYVLVGLGVALALEDEGSEAPFWAFLLTIAVWPTIFMFALTMAVRAVAEARKTTADVRLGWTIPVSQPKTEHAQKP